MAFQLDGNLTQAGSQLYGNANGLVGSVESGETSDTSYLTQTWRIKKIATATAAQTPVPMPAEGITLYYLDNQTFKDQNNNPITLPMVGDSLSARYPNAGQSASSVYNFAFWYVIERDIKPTEGTPNSVDVMIRYEYLHEHIEFDCQSTREDVGYIRQNGAFVKVGLGADANDATPVPFHIKMSVAIPKPIIRIYKTYANLGDLFVAMYGYVGFVNDAPWPVIQVGGFPNASGHARQWLISEMSAREIGHQSVVNGPRRFFVCFTAVFAGYGQTHDPIIYATNQDGKLLNTNTPLNDWTGASVGPPNGAHYWNDFASNKEWRNIGAKRAEWYPTAVFANLWSGQ